MMPTVMTTSIFMILAAAAVEELDSCSAYPGGCAAFGDVDTNSLMQTRIRADSMTSDVASTTMSPICAGASPNLCYMQFMRDTCPAACEAPYMCPKVQAKHCNGDPWYAKTCPQECGGVTKPTTTTTTTIYAPLAVMFKCPGGEAETTTQCMSHVWYKQVSDSVRALYKSLPATCNKTWCPQSDFAGCVLRIAGHDFMDYNKNHQNGGSDGCVLMDDPDNLGLADCILHGEHGVSLQSAYVPFCQSVSLADFLVIAAEAVMTETRENALGSAADTSFETRFLYGRTTRASCGFVHGRLPDAEQGCPAVKSTFLDRMGLDWESATALMGVHTLGRAQFNNSGYHGRWSDAENSRKFNSNYFLSLIGKGWAPQIAVGGNKNKNQWIRIDQGAWSRDNADSQWQKPGKTGPFGFENIITERSRDHSQIHEFFKKAFNSTGIGEEMMLNTDMCFAFGDVAIAGHGNKECCAWTPARHLGASCVAPSCKGGGGSGCSGGHCSAPALGGQNYCGLKNFDFDCREKNRVQCCLGGSGDMATMYKTITKYSQLGYAKAGSFGGYYTDTMDCGYYMAPNGGGPKVSFNNSHPQRSYVEKFAEDENYWMGKFKNAWKVATENGYKLKALEQECFLKG